MITPAYCEMMARFAGDPKPEQNLSVNLKEPRDWSVFKDQRAEIDDALIAWLGSLGDPDLDGAMTWFPGGEGAGVTRSKGLCLTHLFNHQTHHRGQIHAMLTAAGSLPGPTDLPVLTSMT